MPSKKKPTPSSTSPSSASATLSLTPGPVHPADEATPSPRPSSPSNARDGSSSPSKTPKTPQSAQKRGPKGKKTPVPTPSSVRIHPTTSQSPREGEKTAPNVRDPKRKRSRTAGGLSEETRERSLILSLDEDEAGPKGKPREGALAEVEDSTAMDDFILRTKVIAPDISGIACLAVSPDERVLVVARENASLILYDVAYHQNIPHFTQVRHTGGRTHRTITHVEFIDFSAEGPGGGGGIPASRFFIASFLSGQLVLFDAASLFPVWVYQRTGGAIWGFTVVGGVHVLAAIADGAWHQLKVHANSTFSGGWRLELARVIPGVPGADRALAVAASAGRRLAVGSDDAGNIYAWRFDPDPDAAAAKTPGGVGLGRHESLWTTRLPEGMGLCVALTASAVGVGTSTGDVVILDAHHGVLLHSFSQHKGPVRTILSDGDGFYASGWHESLRSYRRGLIDADGKEEASGVWYPAEVKRRTHYHEASQLALFSRRRLLLSASRDGTVLYAPLARLFTHPAMYLNATTQAFAFARAKDVLLQARLGRVEAFRMDGHRRFWVPLFAQNIRGGFHLSGLWCDPRLDFFAFATDERVGLCRVRWRRGAEAALAIQRIDEVLELPAERGVVDALFAPALREERESPPTEGEMTEKKSPRGRAGSLYLLLDDQVVSVTLAEGFPVVRTRLVGDLGAGGPRPGPPGGDFQGEDGALKAEGAAAFARGLRARRLIHSPSPSPGTAGGLWVYGEGGVWRCALTPDGTPRLDDATTAADGWRMARAIPTIRRGAGGGASCVEDRVIGIAAAEGRYLCRGLASFAAEDGPAEVALPTSLPHDVVFIARVCGDGQVEGGIANAPEGVAEEALRPNDRRPREESCRYLGYFSRGLIDAGPRGWKMIGRVSVEAAFVMKDGRHVLVLERNLAKALEALPMCWKVRRFGN
ncbi:unnamed protein product [Phytomonas sp. Hart1]|nr:unnamed protein product [Phytomonas sp. Hart1]|eukprot:CCW70927.1 unnamed protein product [Phytomonas sp. isolate Hart1]